MTESSSRARQFLGSSGSSGSSGRRGTEEPEELRGTRFAWWLIVAAVVTVPLVIAFHASESFRTPKESLFLAFGLTLAALLFATGMRLRIASKLALGAVAWTALATLFSANRAISMSTLVFVAAAAAFVIAVDVVGHDRSPLVIAVPLIPAAINAVVFLLQRFHLWNPMRFDADVPDHFRFTALIGNPDDVGSFLVAPTLVAVALAITDRARRKVWIPASALLLLAIATGRLTSLIACGAGLLAIGFLRSRRAAIIATVALAIGGVVLLTAYRPMHDRATAIMTALRAHDYAEATAGRVTPFLAATSMAKEHPLFGVGPGCFGFEYFPYKLAVEQTHPGLRKAYSASFSYGETHNDYLQTLAETGAVGLGILIFALFVLARSSGVAQAFLPAPSPPPSAGKNACATREFLRAAIVRTVALPVAVATAILCLAQFPLHLAASTVVLLYVGTLCVTWTTAQPRNLATSRPALRIALATVTAIAAAFLIARFAWGPFQCNQRKADIIARTRDAVQVIVEHYRAAEVARENLTRINSCLASDPGDVDLYMLAAANQRLLGRDDDAVAMYRRALSWDRRPEIYYELGVLEIGMNRRAEGIADLRNAAQFSAQYLEGLPADVRDEITAASR